VKLRNQKILFYGSLLILFLVAYQFIPFEPTSNDLVNARQIIQKRASQPILSTEIGDYGEIIVQTGRYYAPLSGNGEKYHLRKNLGRWWVYKKTPWSF
jgi:muramidase (phage lysozyme)